MTGGRSRLLTSLGDQIVSSACSYSLVVLVARGASPGGFGAFLIVFGAVAMALAIGRSAFGLVLGMDLPHSEFDRGRQLERRSVAALLVLGTPVGGILALTTSVVPHDVATVVLLLAAALPLMLWHDLTRYSLVARGHPRAALTADVVWLLPVLVMLGAGIVGDQVLTAAHGAGVWAGSFLVSLIWLALGSHVRGPDAAGLASWLRSDPRRLHLGSDAALSGLAPVGNGLGAAAVAGAVATAAARGAQAMFAPLATLFQAMALGAVPEANRRPPGEALRLLSALSALLVASAVLWSVVLLAIPRSLGVEVLGESWESARPLFPFVAVEYVGLAIWSGGTAMLRYAGATRTALRIRLVYAPATLVLPIAALAATADVRAFAAALAALGAGVGIAGLALGLRHARAAAAA